MNVLAICAGIGGLELGLHLAEPGAVRLYLSRKTPFAAEFSLRDGQESRSGMTCSLMRYLEDP